MNVLMIKISTCVVGKIETSTNELVKYQSFQLEIHDHSIRANEVICNSRHNFLCEKHNSFINFSNLFIPCLFPHSSKAETSLMVLNTMELLEQSAEAYNFGFVMRNESRVNRSMFVFQFPLPSLVEPRHKDPLKILHFLWHAFTRPVEVYRISTWTSGGPFIATSYDYDAPIDEYDGHVSFDGVRIN
uniref:Uncharacterized protein n=1 Tax=Cucumis sativus TaxID=3659 RepID=A0A0A0KMP8_CUCSA